MVASPKRHALRQSKVTHGVSRVASARSHRVMPLALQRFLPLADRRRDALAPDMRVGRRAID